MYATEGTPSGTLRKAISIRYLVESVGVGLATATLTVVILNFPWIAAHVQYQLSSHNKTTATSKVATTSGTILRPDPSVPAQLIIPAINVHAPIVFDEPSRAEWKVQVALRRGVLHYGDTAIPGQTTGNIVIFGHSSGVAWAPGNYKWVFTLLDKLRPGDQIEILYQNIPYTYVVADSLVVKPTDLAITAQTANPLLTLVTCTPVGTSTNRLIVQAKPLNVQAQ